MFETIKSIVLDFQDARLMACITGCRALHHPGVNALESITPAAGILSKKFTTATIDTMFRNKMISLDRRRNGHQNPQISRRADPVGLVDIGNQHITRIRRYGCVVFSQKLPCTF